MKRENVNYLVVGFFVLGLSGLLMVVLYSLAVPNDPRDTYFIHYRNITGVKVGTAVTYGGYRIGAVANIEPERKDGITSFKVHVSVKKDWVVPKDSVARIVAPSFLSDVQIDIYEERSKINLKPGDILAGKEEVSFMTLMNSVADKVNAVSDSNLKPLFHKLDLLVEDLRTKMSQEIPKLAENANKLLLSLNQGSDSLTRILGSENQQLIRNILVNADKMTGKMYDLSANLEQVRAKLSKVMDNTDKILSTNQADVRQAVIALRRSLESISVRVNTIVSNIDQTSRNMSEFSHKIRQNPGLLLGGKPPEEKGINGR